MSVNPIPEGVSTVSPYLAVRGVPTLIDFLKEVFGAIEISRHLRTTGEVANTEIKIGNSTILTGEIPEGQSPATAMLYVYVADVDEVYGRAIAAGGKPVMPPTDMHYGDRAGAVEDASGNQWWIASRLENLTGDEIAKRAPK